MLLIPCPWCGSREESEFTYGGDAGPRMPSFDGTAGEAAWFAYVYRRENPAGPHRELWFHGFGCGRWIVVTRDTTTGEIAAAQDPAAQDPAAEDPAKREGGP